MSKPIVRWSLVLSALACVLLFAFFMERGPDDPDPAAVTRQRPTAKQLADAPRVTLADVNARLALREQRMQRAAQVPDPGPVPMGEIDLRWHHDQEAAVGIEVHFYPGEPRGVLVGTARADESGICRFPEEWLTEHPTLTAVALDDGAISRPLTIQRSLAIQRSTESQSAEVTRQTLDVWTLVGTTVRIVDQGGNPAAHDPQLWTEQGHSKRVHGEGNLVWLKEFLGFEPLRLGLARQQEIENDPARLLVWRVAKSPRERLYGIAELVINAPGYKPERQTFGILPMIFGEEQTLVITQKSDVVWGHLRIDFASHVLSDERTHTGARTAMHVYLAPLNGGQRLAAQVVDPSRGVEFVGVPSGPYEVILGFGSSGPSRHSDRIYNVDVTPEGSNLTMDLDPFGSLRLTGCDRVQSDEAGWRHVRIVKNGVVLRQDRFRGTDVVLEPIPSGNLNVTVGPQAWSRDGSAAELEVQVPASTSVEVAL